mmetsp:Transcript_23707/g.22818  ORF Transcript_23707/g.22818 Transcript_23707/m.22818 type:complete len:80 (-) Transcript_23707:138-377(-)
MLLKGLNILLCTTGGFCGGTNPSARNKAIAEINKKYIFVLYLKQLNFIEVYQRSALVTERALNNPITRSVDITSITIKY